MIILDTNVVSELFRREPDVGLVAWLESRTRGVPDETLAQARGMTPASWLAWLCYDGEIEVASVLPGR